MLDGSHLDSRRPPLKTPKGLKGLQQPPTRPYLKPRTKRSTSKMRPRGSKYSIFEVSDFKKKGSDGSMSAWSGALKHLPLSP